MPTTPHPFPYTTDATQIPTMVLERPREVGDKRSVVYQCPEACFRSHCDEWSYRRRRGERDIPEPMPYGHCMFERPTGYGYVPLGSTDATLIRQAITRSVRRDLQGWDTFLIHDPARFEAIVQASVEARMQGTELGAIPYVACAWASVNA